MQSNNFTHKRHTKQGCVTVSSGDYLAVVYQHGSGWSVRVGVQGESQIVPHAQFSYTHSMPSRRAALRYAEVVISEKLEA